MAGMDVKGLAQKAIGRLRRTTAVPPAEEAGVPAPVAEAGTGKAPVMAAVAALASRLREPIRRAPPPAAAPPLDEDEAPHPGPAGWIRSESGQRTLRRVVACTVAAGVAMSAGQFVQNRAAEDASLAAAKTDPRGIVPLAAGAADLPALPPTARLLPEPAPAPLPAPPPPEAVAEPVAEAPLPAPEPLAEIPVEPVPAALDLAEAEADPAALETVEPEATPVAAACATHIEAHPAPGSAIALRFAAPCHPGAAVVMRHAGLAVSARLDAAGALALAIPALDPAGEVTLRLPDGSQYSAAAPADLAAVTRVALQWQADDGLELHAFEGAADYGTPGHVTALTPGTAPTSASPAAGGWMLRLGDATAPLPMFADIYTFPAGSAPVRLTVEAEVTPAICGAEALGEVLGLAAGRPDEPAEIALAMPGCDALGDFVVLNYPLPGAKITAAAD